MASDTNDEHEVEQAFDSTSPSSTLSLVHDHPIAALIGAAIVGAILAKLVF